MLQAIITSKSIGEDLKQRSMIVEVNTSSRIRRIKGLEKFARKLQNSEAYERVAKCV